MLRDLIAAWARGWSVSRGAPAPVERPWGLRIDVGDSHQMVRYVLPDPDPATVRALAATIDLPASRIKAAAAPETILPALPEGWVQDFTGYFMSCDLRRPAARTLAGDYALATERHNGVLYARVRASDGVDAARGQVALAGDVAVVDKIETALPYRRRGLGTLVMETLVNAALDDGATIGTLGATLQGRALYESLGWSARTPLPGFAYQPAAAARQP